MVIAGIDPAPFWFFFQCLTIQPCHGQCNGFCHSVQVGTCFYFRSCYNIIYYIALCLSSQVRRSVPVQSPDNLWVKEQMILAEVLSRSDYAQIVSTYGNSVWPWPLPFFRELIGDILPLCSPVWMGAGTLRSLCKDRGGLRFYPWNKPHLESEPRSLTQRIMGRCLRSNRWRI